MTNNRTGRILFAIWIAVLLVMWLCLPSCGKAEPEPPKVKVDSAQYWVNKRKIS